MTQKRQVKNDTTNNLPKFHKEWILESRNSLKYITNYDIEVTKKIDNFIKILFLLLSATITIWGLITPKDDYWYIIIGIIILFIIIEVVIILKAQRYSVVNTEAELKDILKNYPDNEEYSYWLLIYAINESTRVIKKSINRRMSIYDYLLYTTGLYLIIFALSIFFTIQ